MSTIKTNQIQHTANGAVPFTLPGSDGSAGQFMKTDGSGALSFGSVSAPVIKEQFLLSCDGTSVSTSNGTVSITNVTGTQDLTGSNATLTGSEISYQPPTGTTCVIYEVITSVSAGDNDGIYNFCLFIDGTQIVYSGLSGRGSYNGSTPIHFKWAINIGGSADNNTGRQASWSSAKTLLIKARDYDTNHDQVAHMRNHFQMGGGNFRQPQIGITAIG